MEKCDLTTQWEEEFEEWFRQQDSEPTYGYPWNLEEHKHIFEEWKVRFFSAKSGYLQACRKRQEEMERLKKRIYDQAITISKLFPCASIDESEEEAK